MELFHLCSLAGLGPLQQRNKPEHKNPELLYWGFTFKIHSRRRRWELWKQCNAWCPNFTGISGFISLTTCAIPSVLHHCKVDSKLDLSRWVVSARFPWNSSIYSHLLFPCMAHNHLILISRCWGIKKRKLKKTIIFCLSFPDCSLCLKERGSKNLLNVLKNHIQTPFGHLNWCDMLVNIHVQANFVILNFCEVFLLLFCTFRADYCTQALSKRIHYGKFVAEAKFLDDRRGYTMLIENKDSDAIMELLTNKNVEEQVDTIYTQNIFNMFANVIRLWRVNCKENNVRGENLEVSSGNHFNPGFMVWFI